MSTTSAGPRKTVGLIIIGDEVLKGQIADENIYYLCKEFYALGVKVAKVSVIGDGLEEIANEVRSFSEGYDWVVTTGGIGPTHDDITYAGVGHAFNDEVVENSEMKTMIDKWLGHKGYEQDVLMKMAAMPSSAKLIFDPAGYLASFPIVNVRNVYVFPGIPQYLRKLFPRLRPMFKCEAAHHRVIYVARDELSIVPQLNEAVNKFKDSGVVFGSYPVVGNLYYATRLTLEASSSGIVNEANTFLADSLPEASVVQFDSEPIQNAMEKVYAIAQDETNPLHGPVKISVMKIEECLTRYNLSNICVCFNGGKDCTALLHLFHAVLQKKQQAAAAEAAKEGKERPKLKIPTLCFRIQDPFPEMEDFIRETGERYNLEIRLYNGPIITGLKEAVTEHTEIQAVLMGTRRSDPSGLQLDYFQMTDPSWPQVMRVSPLLDWTYSQVWQFLRHLTLPYCSLYDKGYTSIGNRSNTTPNESLAFVNESGVKSYRPAYTLHDCSEERRGRS